MENSRNIIFAVLACALIIFGWDAAMNYYYPQPDAGETNRADTPAERLEQETGNVPSAPGVPATESADKQVDLATALSSAQRVRIDAPRVAGSINLVGARIDDVELKDHRETVEKNSGPVQLFAPEGTATQQYAQFGWIGSGVRLPDAQTRWQADGDVLTQAKPVTLSWNNGGGQTFRIRFTIDDNYMITAKQTVANTGGGPIVARPFATITRTSKTASKDTWISHSGPIGTFSDSVEYDPNYGDLVEDGPFKPEGQVDWIGFTDIYWLGALVPQADAQPDSGFRSLGNDLFRADLIYKPETIAPGTQVSRTTRLFAGAKDSTILDAYQDAGIPQFGLAVDWGWFRWFEKPMLWLLRQLFSIAGNFGVAIILLTVIVRGIMFPVAQKGFASMASMKAIQPKMKALQERYKDDKVKQQEEIQKLFKAEGVNPLAGCLPMLLQVPVFFALYKVLILAIEMRHQPFILWIKDLSAPDPAHVLNLFGLIDFSPPGFLAIGPLALLLGFTMWATFKLNPAAMDPTQRQIFNIMPWIMMFVMAPFAAGLLLYWNTSNILTLLQQRYLYSKHPQLRAQADEDRKAKEAGKDKAKA